MKGIIIYENDLRAINAVKLKNASFCYESIEDDKTDTLQGTPVICESVNCNKEDTYDFETGALIALMKMCGSDKVVRACNEAFSYERDLQELRKDNNHLREANKGMQEEINALKEENKKLRDENVDLECRKTCNETTIELLYNTINTLTGIDDKYKELKEEKEKFQHEYDLCKNSENALKCSVDYLNKTIAKLNAAIYGYKEDLYKATKRCEELEIKESTINKQQEQLDKREEKISVYFGGRGNGKQYKALVELFKKLDQKKVDAAYKEAYDKWIKLPSPRERMWDDILKEGRTPVYVKREDIHAFLEECQVIGIKWATGKMPLETMPFHMSKGYDRIYFFVMTSLDISKSTPGSKEFRHVMCWWMTASDEEARNSVKYIAPMRWDLFKKGRLVVKVDTDNYEDFYNKCEEEIGRKPLNACKGTFTVYYSKGTFHRRPYKDDIPFAKKIVDWEDVR